MILSRLRWFLGRLVSPAAPATATRVSKEIDMPAAEVWLVVGLGNPGRSTPVTVTTSGYLVADELANRLGSPFRAHKTGRADVVEGRLGAPGDPGPRLVLARPRSFMNELGGAVKALATFYKVPPDRIVAIHDELRPAVRVAAGQARWRRQRPQRAALPARVARHRRLLPGAGRHRPLRRGDRTWPTSCSPTTRCRAQGAAVPGRPGCRRRGDVGGRGSGADAAEVQLVTGSRVLL